MPISAWNSSETSTAHAQERSSTRRHFVQTIPAGLIAALSVLGMFTAENAHAAVITFDTAPLGLLTSPITEDGFTYSRFSGQFVVNDKGVSGNDMEGEKQSQGGSLQIVSAGSNPEFTFSSVDFSYFSQSGYGGPTYETLVVEGYWKGLLAAWDTFNLNPTGVSDPTYENWTTESAVMLAGVPIDSLHIVTYSYAGVYGTGPILSENIDNVVLMSIATPNPVPEPGSLALFGTGLLGLGTVIRRR